VSKVLWKKEDTMRKNLLRGFVLLFSCVVLLSVQSHAEKEEFAQESQYLLTLRVLSLYPADTEVAGIDWEDTGLDLGLVKKFDFGKAMKKLQKHAKVSLYYSGSFVAVNNEGIAIRSSRNLPLPTVMNPKGEKKKITSFDYRDVGCSFHILLKDREEGKAGVQLALECDISLIEPAIRPMTLRSSIKSKAYLCSGDTLVVADHLIPEKMLSKLRELGGDKETAMKPAAIILFITIKQLEA